MSLSPSESDGFYARMSRLELKLKESEEERLELEEKFNRLLHTCKSKQTMQLQQLRNCYRQLLEQDRLRCERNDTILRTLHRIEDRASTLTAKTDRLRLLKKHFESSLDCNYHDKKRSNSVNYLSPRSSLSDINAQSSTLQPISHSLQPLESFPPLHFSRTPSISRRSSLVVPDSELLEFSKYKSSNESSRRRLFDDSVKSKLPIYSDILSAENEFIGGSIEISTSALQRTLSNAENIGVRKNREIYFSNNWDSVKKNSSIKEYEHPTQSVVSENSFTTRFSSKGTSARPLTKSSSFSAIQKHITYSTPEKHSLNRRSSLIPHRSIFSQESNRSHSSLASTTYLAYNRTKSPLGVVDDIFKKYLINYDKRYLSDPISESKYGRYLYPSRSHDNESLTNSSAIVNRSSIPREQRFELDKNDKYFDSTFHISRLSDQHKSNGSSESLYSLMPRYKSPDLLNYSSQSSYPRNDWKEWDQFRGRYQYSTKVETDIVQNNRNYVDDLAIPNYSESIKNELKPFLSYDCDGDSAIEGNKPYSTRENNYQTMLDKENKPLKFKSVLENPLLNTHAERDIGPNVTYNKNFDYDIKQKDNYTKIPQIPKRVSFSNTFLYDDKSDTDLSPSPEEEKNIIEDTITSQIQQHPEKEFVQSTPQSQLVSEAVQQDKNFLSDPTVTEEYFNSSENRSYDSNRETTRYNHKETDEADSDPRMLNSGSYFENKGTDKKYLIHQENGHSDNVVKDEGEKEIIPNSEEFKTKTKRRTSLFLKDELSDSVEDLIAKSKIKENSDLQTLKGLATSEDLSEVNNVDEQVELDNDSLFNKSKIDNKEYFSKVQNVIEDSILISPEINKNVLKTYSQVESGQDKNIPADSKNICDAVNKVPKSGKDKDTINKQENKTELDKIEQYDNKKIKESFEIKQSDQIMEEKMADSSQNQSDIILNDDNSKHYQALSEDSKYQSYSNGSLSEEKPASVFGEEYSDDHYNQAQQEHEQYKQQEKEGFTGDTYTDQNVTVYQGPIQEDQYPQEYHQQPEIYEGEFHQQPEIYEGEYHPQPLDYNINNYRQDETQAEQYQTNEYIQDQYGQDYVEEGRDSYSPSYYQQNSTEKDYSTTQLERDHPHEYSQQPVQYDDNYQEPSQQLHNDQRLYESDYENPQYQYGQQKEIYGQVNIPEQYDQEYQSQQLTEQYENNPSQYDTQVTAQFNQQYQNQHITEQYGNQYEDQPNKYDSQITDQYDQQYQNMHGHQTTEQYEELPNRYDTQVPDQFDTQITDQYDQHTTEQYDKQYEEQANRYDTQVPAHYESQITDQYDQLTTEQYEKPNEDQDNQYDTQVPAHYDSQITDQYDQLTTEQYDKQYEEQDNQYDTQVPAHYDSQITDQYDQLTTEQYDKQYEEQDNQYDTQVPAHYDSQITDQYDQQTTDQYDKQYEGQSNQYDNQVPDQYNQQYQEQYDHQTPDQYQDPQYQGQHIQYEGQESNKYNEAYQLQPNEYQSTDQYDQQYPDHAPEQYDQQYENQPDQYEQQYSGYEHQSRDQYDENYQAQPDQYEYENQQTTDQYNELYQGEPVQHGYNEQQEPFVEDTQYLGEHSYKATVGENQAYGSSEHISQDRNKPSLASTSSQDHLLPNSNQDTMPSNVSVQPTPKLKPKTSEKMSTKVTHDLNQVLESDSESLHTRGSVSQDYSSEFDFSLGKK